MKFTYTAKTQRGELQSGLIEAGTRDAAVATLQGYGLVVLRLQEEVVLPWYLKLFSFGGHVSVKDLALFTRQFATLLEAQVPLVDSLRTMFQQTQNSYLKESVFDVISDVEAGAPLSQAFAKHESIFSHFYVEMVKSAEITGRLQEVLSYLAEYYENQAELVAKVKGALIYPAFVFVLFALVVAVMITSVIPQLIQIIAESGTSISTLPLATQLLFSLSTFVKAYGWATSIMVIVAVGSLWTYLRSEEGKSVLELFTLSLPLVGQLARKVYLARFTETLSVMIAGDIPVAQALEVSGDVVGNIGYQESLHDAADAVRRGELISQALSRYQDKFPPLVIQMVAVGERTGRVDQLLSRASHFYTKEVEESLGSLTELIQPALIVILAIFVGLLIGAIILPIYQIAQTF